MEGHRVGDYEQLDERASYFYEGVSISEAMRSTTPGQLRPGVDERLARMLILGSLNWSTEWWQPRGESVDTLVQNAKRMLNGGFLKEVDNEVD